MRRGPVLLVLVGALGCSSPGLTQEEAAKYQACAADQDCVLDVLDCKGSCGSPVAIAGDQQTAFEQARGCWPPNSEIGGSVCDRGCQRAICAGHTCAVSAQCGSFGGTAGGTSGGTTGGFTSTTGGFTSTTGGFTSSSGGFTSTTGAGSGSSSGSSGSGGTT